MTITIRNTPYTLLDAKNPVWADKEKTTITLDCKFSHYAEIGITENNGYASFCAHPDDSEPHGVEILEKAKAGEYGVIGDYVAPSE